MIYILCFLLNEVISLLRSGQQSSAVRETHTADEGEEESTLRRTIRERSASVQREKPQHDICEFF